ncbi:Transcriptional activator spt7 [Malassezia equina]|uniref:Transcriptional activator spt7 n=1 Tax=Malassezia equina TaxID=1381935 RepID=A0AAF0EHT6_9BASI|nr:Transcriptional activator spt7 [Malassezia equina]
MDLGTMQKKLRSGQYKTKAQFAHDLNLIWDNCLVYNASPVRFLFSQQQHPLRRNATYMRKKSNHLLEFLSEKNDTKDLLSQWHPASLRVTPAPSTPGASPAAASGTPAPAPANDATPSSGAAVAAPATSTTATPGPTDVVPGTMPLGQQPALRRSIDATHMFMELDEALNQVRQPHDTATAWDALQKVPASHRDPLAYALRTASESVHRAWWAACQSDSLVCAGLPTITYRGAPASNAFSTSASAEAGPSRAPMLPRLPMDRPGVPRLMARNIRTLRRLYHTHNKFFQLAEAVDMDLPVPASVGEISEDEAEENEEEAPVLVPPQPYETTAPFPRLTSACAREQMSWQVQTLLAHAGFEGGHTAPVQVLAQVASEYLMGLGRTLRLYSDRFAHSLEPGDMLEHVLSGGASSIESYVRNDIERYGQRLKEWLRKMHTALRDQLQSLGGSVEDTDLLARDGEALVLGHFAAGLGDDFFGFRELGLDSELGISHLAVPSRLFFGGRPVHKAAVGGTDEAAPTYTPPPPPVVVTRAAVSAQIGLLRPWYLSEMGSNATLPEQVPERPRYKVPTNGKLPARMFAGDDEARAAKTPTKRKRVV